MISKSYKFPLRNIVNDFFNFLKPFLQFYYMSNFSLKTRFILQIFLKTHQRES